MKIQIELQQPRWLARFPRPVRGLLVALTVLLAAAVPVAWASDVFTDVPGTNPHHDDITSIYNARITTGCSAGQYCPGDAVLRQSMASFMRRGFGRVAYASGGNVNLTLGAEQDLAVASIVTGGAPGGTGFVKVDATGHVWALAGAISITGPVRVRLRATRDDLGPGQPLVSSPINFSTLVPTASGGPNPNVSSAVTWVIPVPTATTLTFRVKGELDWGDGVVAAQGQISLAYFPFGSFGSSTLSTGATSDAPTGHP